MDQTFRRIATCALAGLLAAAGACAAASMAPAPQSAQPVPGGARAVDPAKRRAPGHPRAAHRGAAPAAQRSLPPPRSARLRQAGGSLSVRQRRRLRQFHTPAFSRAAAPPGVLHRERHAPDRLRAVRRRRGPGPAARGDPRVSPRRGAQHPAVAGRRPGQVLRDAARDAGPECRARGLAPHAPEQRALAPGTWRAWSTWRRRPR